VPHSPLTSVLHYVRRLGTRGAGEESTDGELLRRFVTQRDEAAFAALLRRHGPLVYGVCRQVLGDEHAAEDVFQATFLVLARKAATVRRHGAVSAWLYRVACNLARTARRRAARRRTHEREAATMTPNVSGEAASGDWQPLLEEVDRLPAKYRAVVVLCYLQGRTHPEAAADLGWPVGTVKGRLGRARDLLRRRLIRRGLAPAAAGAADLLARPAEAAVPEALFDSTLRAATRFAAGQATAAGLVSAEADALAKGALRMMTLTRLTMLTTLCLAALLGAGGVWLAVLRAGPGEPGERPAEKPPAPPEAGRASDPGRPVNGLQLILEVPPEFNLFTDPETTLLPDGSNVRPFALRLVYRNTGDRPLKLDMSPLPDLVGSTLDITGPDAGSVRFVPKAQEFELRGAIAADFHLLRPGETWERTLNFPANEFCWGHFFLTKPGLYRMRATYKLERETKSPFAAGSWTGSVTSNELTLLVAAEEDFGPEVNGLRAKAPLQSHRFPVGGPIQVGFTVKNVSPQPQVVWHSGYWPNHQVVVQDAAGKEPPLTPRGEQVRKAFAPGGERGKNVPAEVLPGHEDLESWQDVTTLYDLTRPGRYRVRVVYEEKQGGWQGRLPSAWAEFEVVPRPRPAREEDLAKSAAVTVDGVEFQAVVDPTCVIPPPGGRRTVRVGVRYTNRGDRQVLLHLGNLFFPSVQAADGRSLVLTYGRKRTSIPGVLVLEPGRSETLLLNGVLSREPDGSGLQLGGSDPSAAFWSVRGLAPGKYRLSVRYENKQPTDGGGRSCWMGDVTTEEVGFEIVEGR
jgi:RNA polymerase sigma factor (sigma-70 family)